MQEYCVIAFANARVATKGQNILQQTGLKAFLMPTPREITASCGLSLRLSPKDGPRAREALDAAGLPDEERRFYHMSYDEHHRSVVPAEELTANSP